MTGFPRAGSDQRPAREAKAKLDVGPRSATSSRPSLRSGILAGFAGTVAMDSASTLLARGLGAQRPDPANVGRWIGHMRSGKFVHKDLRLATPVAREKLIGVAAHYTIGATLGTGYALLARRQRRHPTLAHAAGYGALTTAFAWFAMFPAWGLGYLARKGPPRQWALSLASHLVFGLALGLAGRRHH